jgi:hypothetical protein
MHAGGVLAVDDATRSSTLKHAMTNTLTKELDERKKVLRDPEEWSLESGGTISQGAEGS